MDSKIINVCDLLITLRKKKYFMKYLIFEVTF